MSQETAALPRRENEVETGRSSRSIVVSTPFSGMLWFGGWLFTLGLAHLSFWKALLALVIWPYFLGVLAR